MLNVLIVEDDLSIADLLRSALEAEGYCVSGIARTVDEAIGSAAEHEPDFAVIDLRLADGGLGSAVGIHLRNSTSSGILFSTGNSSDISLTRAEGDAMMIKPYRMRDVGRALAIIGQLAQAGETSLVFPRNFRLLDADTT
jgi:DNA-binding response OmpR family regulator